jgi:hypothetical protein
MGDRNGNRNKAEKDGLVYLIVAVFGPRQRCVAVLSNARVFVTEAAEQG